MTTTNISVMKGRRLAFSGTITKNGSAYNLIGYSLKFIAKKKKTDADADIVIEKALTINDAARGTYTGVLLPSETDDFDIRSYDYEIAIYDETGAYIYTPIEGKMSIENVVKVAPNT